MKSSRRILAAAAKIALAGLFIIAANAAGAPSAFAQSNSIPKRIVGDYGYWSKYDEPSYSSAQIPYNELTHINHASISFGSDATLNVPEGFLEPELISNAHAAGVKVLVLLGGDFSTISADPSLIPTLVSNLFDFINQNGYDGVDVDWEYPLTSADRAAFIGLMRGLREALPSPNYTISADVAPWGGADYGFAESAPAMDYLNIMMYDCAGPWTDDGQLNSPIIWDPRDPEPYECEPGGSVQQAIRIYAGLYGISHEKLNMGSPFYGYYYTTINKEFGGCPLAQADGGQCGSSVLTRNYGTYFKQRVNQKGWVTYYDPFSMVPYMLRADGSNGYITYDDEFSTYSRVFYSDWTNGLGGTFMWSLDADYDGKSQDLLTAMYAATLQLPMPPQQ